MNRKPPLPDHFNNPIPGTCRWCNLPITKILKNGQVSKSTWHKECLPKYKILHWPSTTRRAVWKRDLGKCASCGIKCDRKGKNGWHLDHIIPIHLGNDQLWIWQLPNLQTLCKPCHKIKTSSEATNRAITRKLNLR